MKEALELLVPLATKLGTTVEYLWTVLVQQGHIHLLKSALGLVVGVAAAVTGARYMVTTKTDPDRNCMPWIWAWAGVILGSLFALIGFCELQTPEAWALKAILGR